jgi:hypothetical protein
MELSHNEVDESHEVGGSIPEDDMADEDEEDEEDFIALLKKYETEDIEKLRQIVAEGLLEE